MTKMIWYLSPTWMVGISVACTTAARLLQLGPSSTTIAHVFVWSLIGQFAVWAFYTVFLYPYLFSPFRHLPQPKGGWPLIGHTVSFWKHGPAVMAQKWITETENDGYVRVLLLFNSEYLVVGSPKVISEVLVTSSYSFERPGFIRQILAFVLGWGVLTVEGDEHKIQRRKLLPAFAFRHIKDLYPLFWQRSCEVIDEMTAACGGRGQSELEVYNWAGRVALDIIGIAAAGVDFQAIKNADNELASTYKQLSPSPQDFSVFFLRRLVPGFIFRHLPIHRIQQLSDSSKRLRVVCRQIVQEKTARLANKEGAGHDILTVALSANVFSEEALVDQMLTFITAGHDTTATSLIWAVYLLSKYPAIQDRLRQEIRANLPSPKDHTNITNVEIDKLHYLNAVCSEVLRVKSPVQLIPRVAATDTTIQGQFIPRGTMLHFSVWATNTDSTLWGDDSDDFNPDRWLDLENGGSSGGVTTNYAFMTFGHGPHGCIGKSFARSELACLLAAWIGRFSFEIKDKSLLDEKNLVVNSSVVARPENGLDVLVSVVDGW